MSWDLTKPGIQYDPTIDENGHVIPPHVAFFPNKAARALQFAKDASAAVQPSTSDTSGAQLVPTDYMQDEAGGPLHPTNSGTVGGSVQDVTPPAVLPRMFQPSFSQVTQDQSSGLPLPVNGAETKLGKLVHILTGAAQGGLAAIGTGNAQQGMEAARQAEMLPYQRVLAAQNLAKTQAQTELARAEVEPVSVPGYEHPMPMWLARFTVPATIRAQALANTADVNARSRANVADINAHSRENVAQINKRFMAVPNVGLFDTQSRQIVPETEQGIQVTPAIAEDYNLPDEFVGKQMHLSNFAQLERAAAPYAPTTSTTTDTSSGHVTTTQKTPPGRHSSFYRPTGGANAGGVHTKGQDAADAEVLASKIMNAAGGDPDKALTLFDQQSPNITDPEQRRLGPAIRNAIRARRRVNKPPNPIDQILSGDVQGGLNALQSPQQ